MVRISVMRWLDVLAVGTLCAVLFLLVDDLFDVSSAALRHLFGLPTWVMVSTSIVLTVGLLYPAISIADPRLAHFHPKVLLKYPPIIVSVFCALFLAWFLNTVTTTGHRYETGTWLTATGLLIASMVAVIMMRWLGTRAEHTLVSSVSNSAAEQHPASRGDDPLERWAFARIKAWATREESIRSASDDLFDHKQIAGRIASRICEGLSHERKTTFGIIGNFGSGKTGIVELLREELRRLRAEQILLCRVSCWGFDDPSAVLEHVLSSAIATISRRADCLAFRGLPEAYSRAVSSVHPLFQGLLDLFPQERDPSRLLQQLSPVLQALGLELVIAIEDIDRDGHSEGYLQSIQAMLNTIKSDVPRVTFILSGSPSVVDFVKLCDHIEQVAPVSPSYVSHTFETVRNHLLTMYTDIDPVGKQARDAFELEFMSSSSHREMLWQSFGRYSRPLNLGVATLLSTPRSLKHVVRRVIAVWERLHGEVNLDHLILVSIIRNAAPEAYEFLMEHIDSLRIPKDSRSSRDDKTYSDTRSEFFRAEWDKYTAKAKWDPNCVKDIICFLVPAAALLLGREANSFSAGLQSISHTEPTDYWRRIQAESISPNEVHDQQVLKDIADWMTKPEATSSLIQRLIKGGRYADVWEYFSARLTDESLLKLAEQVLVELLRQSGSQATMENSALLGIWRQAHRRMGRSDGNADWIAERAEEALSVSIRLANDLYYYWASMDYGLVLPEGRTAVRTRIYERAKELYSVANSKNLAGSLTTEYPWVIRHLILPPLSEREEASVFSQPQDWTWFAPTLLAAAEEFPDVLIPQLMCLVGRQRDHGLIRTIEIDEEFVSEMFGDASLRLYSLLGMATCELPKNDRLFFESIRSEATEMLA